MANLGSLIISLEANTAKFEAALTRSEYLTKKSSDNIKNALAGIGGALAGAISVAKLESLFKGIMDTEAALLKMATRLNTDVETLSSFGIVARKTGMDAETFNMALTRMERTSSIAAKGLENTTGKLDENGEEIGKGIAAYRELGINAAAFIQLPMDQKLMAFATAMKANISPADQVRIAMEVFGKGGAGMVNIFKEGPEAIAKWIARQKELGVITTEGAQRATAFKGSVADLASAWGSFTRQLADSVAPGLTWLVQSLTKAYLFSRDIANRLREMGNAPPASGARGGGGGGAWIEPGDVPTLPSNVFQAPSRSSGAKAGGGKGSGDMGLDRMSTIIDTLRKDLNKLTEGSLAEIEAWGLHMRNEIEKVGAKGADTDVASALVNKLEIEKKKKATDDYGLFVAKESGDTYAIIDAQGKADFEKYKGFATAKAVTDAATGRKKIEQTAKNNEEVWGLQKNIFDSLSSLTPVISEQNFLKTKSLDLEILIGKSTLDRKLAELELSRVISKAQADEYRGMQALADQAKKYSLEREKWTTQGIGGGLRMGAYDLQKTADTWTATQISDFVKNAPRDISASMARTFVDTLQGKKTDFEQMAWSMAESFIQKMLEGWLNQIVPVIANSLSSLFSGIGSGGGGGDYGIGAVLSSLPKIFGEYHSGGIIRAHGGLNLASDEIPIIAQTGERVLSRGQNAAYEAGVQVNFTVINNSSKVETKTEQNAQGDIVTTIDDLAAQAFGRGRKLYKAINSGSGAMKR